MIVKILGSASASFHGVQYNDRKIEKGSGELTLMKNFPSFINEDSSQQQVRDYLKSITKNDKVRKPQFHAVISTKFQEHSKDELTKIAEHFMGEMGYGTQPMIVVFHKDTDNNHVHVISTRVDKQSGKKLNDSYERLKAQKALARVMEKLYGQDQAGNLEKLLTYRVSSFSQLETLLQRNGFKMSRCTDDENSYDILKNGVRLRKLSGNEIVFRNAKNDNRLRQLRAILNKYKELYSNKVFKVVDNRQKLSLHPKWKSSDQNNSKIKIEFESELQKKLKNVFGIDIVFHQKADLKPFGYTLIDHKSGTVYKGSEILKMNELFEFTTDVLDKKLFEILKDYNVPDRQSRDVLLKFLQKHYQEVRIKEYMLFENRGRKDLTTYRKVQSEVKDFIRNREDINYEKKHISIVKSEDGKFYAVHTQFHYIGELRSLIGEKEFQQFLNPHRSHEVTSENNTEKTELNSAVSDMIFEWMKNSGGNKDPAENELKKRRKKRR